MDTMTKWAIGNDPMLHDLWELQVSLEQAMLRDGIETGATALFQPTVIPPRPWTPARKGGYFTPYAESPEPLYANWRSRPAADFHAINALQETPWRIDPKALAAAERSARRRPPTAAVEMTLRIARRYQRWPFYFPYCWDAEGQARPIAQYLQPQGDNLARSLLVSPAARTGVPLWDKLAGAAAAGLARPLLSMRGCEAVPS